MIVRFPIGNKSKRGGQFTPDCARSGSSMFEISNVSGMSDFSHTRLCDGYRRGKSLLSKVMLEYALNAGKTVIALRGGAFVTIERVKRGTRSFDVYSTGRPEK